MTYQRKVRVMVIIILSYSKHITAKYLVSLYRRFSTNDHHTAEKMTGQVDAVSPRALNCWD